MKTNLKMLNRIVSAVLLVSIFMGSFPAHGYDKLPLPESDYDASLSSLINQINTGGIGIYALNSRELPISPSGSYYGTRVAYKINTVHADYEGEKTVTVTFILNGTCKEEVSFDYSLYSGSAFLYEHFNGAENGSITFEPGEIEKRLDITIKKLVNKPSSETPQISSKGEFWRGERIFYINCSNIINALFEGDSAHTTVPVRVQNNLDLEKSYERARDAYIADIPEILNTEYNGSSGKYKNVANIANISTSSAIAGDVRAMIDMEVFTHLNLLQGYFLNEGGASGKVHFNIERNNKFGSENVFKRDIDVSGKNKIDFEFNDVLISDLGIGRYAEANRIAESLNVNLDYSGITEDVYTVFCDSDNNYIDKQMNFTDGVKPHIDAVSAVSGEFRLGEKIPLTVTFNEPVLTDGISIRTNGTTLRPVEKNGTISETVSFLYEVRDDYKNVINVTDIAGAVDLSGKQQDGEGASFEVTGASLKPYSLKELFAYCADTDVIINQGNSTNAEAEIKISLEENEELSIYMLEHRKEDGRIDSVKATVIGKVGSVDVPLYANEGPVITELTGRFQAPVNMSDTDMDYSAEIYFDENTSGGFELIYLLSKDYTIPYIVCIGEDDFEIVYTKWPEGNKTASDSEDSILLGINVKVNATWQRPEDFVWSGSDNTVASITSSGAITLTGKAGIVRFELTALNTGLEGKEVTIYSAILEVVDTSGTFLKINDWAKNIEVTQGNDARIYYSTNITENNADSNGSETVTEYIYDLYEAVYEGGELRKGDHVVRQTASSTVQEPAFSFAVNSKYLVNTSSRGKCSYILEVSATDMKSGMTLSASANIRVKSLPAKAELIRPDNLYITDENQTFSMKFNIENKNSSTSAELSVIKNNEETVFSTDNAEDSGKELSMDISRVADRLYDIYTVSLKAKNEFDEAESYDSYFLRVYNSDALKIFVNGESRETFTISRDDLGVMTSEEILKLNRNIALKDDIGINYNQFNWSKIYDKITWSVSDGGEISLRQRDGGILDDAGNEAELFPDARMILEGIWPGEGYVTARHNLTGMEERLNVTVDDLRNKLFLFSVYPGQGSKVAYINGEGVHKDVHTDGNGQLAVFEESGIQSDVTFYPAPENSSVYETFILTKGELKSGQTEQNYAALYPQNHIMFKSAGQDVIFQVNVTDSKGTSSYYGDILIKGGVYRNGKYCPGASINGIDGRQEQLLSSFDSTYKLKLNFSEFINENETGPVARSDELEYIFEINIPGNYYSPVFMTVDSEEIRMCRILGSRIVYGDRPTLRSNYDTRIEDGISITSQNIAGGGSWHAMSENIIIEDTSEEAYINTEMVYKGNYRSSIKVEFVDSTDGMKHISDVETASYEFSDTVLIKSSFDLRQYASRLKPGEQRTLSMQISIKGDGKTEIINIPTNLKVSQFTGVAGLNSLQDGELKKINQDIKSSIKVPSSGIGGLGDYIDYSIKHFGGYSMDSESVRLEITPTDNPLVFRGVVKIAVGQMSKYVKPGVYSTDEEASLRYGYMPKYGYSNSNYVEDSKIYMEAYMGGYGSNKKMYGGGAYLDCEIFYDIDDGQWKILLLKSFVHIGGGYHYKQIYNTWIGIVPVTAEFLAGGAGMVALKTVLDESKSERRYITELQPQLYIRGFGGVGRDYEIVSMKVGVYGKLSLDQRYLWLNSRSSNSNGQQITVRGETGIEYKIKLVLTSVSGSYEIGKGSNTWTFNDFNNIKRIYDSGSSARTAGLMGSDGEYEPDGSTGTSFEDRSYLINGRQWNTARAKVLSSEGIKVMQTNAYPYSNPVMTSDGELMVYISDMDSAVLNDAAICYSLKSGEYFPKGIEIDASGYADTDAVIDGTSEGAAAAWVRVVTDELYEAGDEASAEDIKKMLSGTEVMAAIYDGSEFTVTRMTDNSAPDMSPVVASDGRRAIVAWRSLYAGDIDNPLLFDGRDSIMYRVFDGSEWGEEKCLYDGSIDRVISIDTKMLSSGTSAVTYEVEAKDGNTEIYCTVINEDGDIINNIRLTDNEGRDENPRITSVEFPDGVKRFIIGWNQEAVHEGEVMSSIRITAVDGGGNIYAQFENEIEPSSTADYGSFKFTKGAGKLKDLSVVWAQPDFDSDDEYKYSLYGRKFLPRGSDIVSISPEIKLAELNKSNVVDFFDACTDGTGHINFMIQSTDYGAEEKSSSMLYAGTAYSNKLYAGDAYYSRKEILPGTEIPVMFRLYNGGMEPVECISIILGGTAHEFGDGRFIMPGEYKDVNVFYSVPEVVDNPAYIITAEYPSSVDTISGTLHMDLPDVGIYGVEIEKESERERMFSVLLHNNTFSKLSEGRHAIKLYAYDNPDFSGMPIASETISDAESFDMINGGVIKKYILLDEDALQTVLNEYGEIPEDGVRIFFNAVLEQDGDAIADADITNNYDYVKIRSLFEKNTGKVLITSMMRSGEGRSHVQVEALNNSMNEIKGGIKVALRDGDGKIIETRSTESLTIEGEETHIASFAFNREGASFDAEYTDGASDNGNGSSVREKDGNKDIKYINPFKDVKETDWFYEAVKFVVENKLMIGTSYDKFEPEMPVTRGMLVTVLHRLENEPVSVKSSFSDISEGEYYSDAVAWAQQSGIINGMSESMFGPDEKTTREQFAAILYRYALYKEYGAGTGAELSSYQDAHMISDYALNAMQWAVGEAIIKGRSNANLWPSGNTTRAEMAEMLYRFIMLYK